MLYARRSRRLLTTLNDADTAGMRASGPPWAQLLAQHQRARFKANWGLAETGAAGPRSLSGLGVGPRWIGMGVEARREAQAGSTPGESLQRRIRPHSGPTRRAGAIRGAIRRCWLVVWASHTASPAPSLAPRLAPARTQP